MGYKLSPISVRFIPRDVTNGPDPIKDLYNMYSGKEEEVSRIVELGDMDLDFSLKDGPADPFLEL